MIRIKNKRLFILLFDLAVLVAGFCMKPITIFMKITKISECFLYKHGIICPGCGGTRCVNNFFSGNFAKSFEFHPFVFCLIWYLVLIILLLNLDFLFNLKFARKINRFLVDYRVLTVIFISFALFGISRNFIPFINPFPRL